MNSEVSSIVSESVSKKTDEMDVADMAEMLKSMPKQEEMVKNYKIHIELLKKITTESTQRRLQKIVDLE